MRRLDKKTLDKVKTGYGSCVLFRPFLEAVENIHALQVF